MQYTVEELADKFRFAAMKFINDKELDTKQKKINAETRYDNAYKKMLECKPMFADVQTLANSLYDYLHVTHKRLDNPSLIIYIQDMDKQKYTFFSAGELENEIAGKWAYQPLGLLMVYASKLADEFYEGVNDTVGPMLQDTVDDLYDAYAEITDKNARMKALKRIRVWVDVVIDAVSYVEERTDNSDFTFPKKESK